MPYDWIQLHPVHVPPGRFEYAMARDGVSTMMFGGRQNTPLSAILNDTWTWNGTDWTEKFPVTSPSARWSPGFAYDIANDNVVMFGGNTSAPGPFADGTDETWIWDRTNWTQLFPAHSPSARTFPTMAYDEANSNVVLFGGRDTATNNVFDTWTWNGTDWTEVFPAHAPAGDNWAELTFDHSNGVVVRSGGTDTSKTWTWDGTDWTALSPAHTSPGAIIPGLTDWQSGGKVFHFGGRNGFSNLVQNTTWLWDGTDWTQASPAHSPGGREDMSIVYDPVHDQILLFGGLVAATPQFEDTWVYADTASFTLHLEN